MHIQTRLTKQVELGASRRDVEDLEIIPTDGGHETRNLRASQSLLQFDVSFPISRRDNARLLEVRDCFKATRGGHDSFDFCDWLDHVAADEPLGSGEGDGATVTFGLAKLYAFGLATHLRRIQRPVAPITVKVAGVTVAPGDYVVDYQLGTVTFDAAPANLAALTWSGEFNVPVRFDGMLETQAATIDNEKIGTVPLVEVRLKAGDFAA